MDYHGFRSVKEYEKECARVGFSTRRIPFHKGNEKYFALVTSPPKTGTSIEAWTKCSPLTKRRLFWTALSAAA